MVAACGFSADVPAPAPGVTMTIVDDTFDGDVVDGYATPDRIEVDGFVLGGLHAVAYPVQLVDNGEDFTKVLADAAAATPAGAGYAQVPANWVQSRPRGLGLILDNSFTVIWDGEILLPKGAITLEADIDDRGIVQVGDGELLGVPNATAPRSITFTVDEAGWYPIRAAMSENSGNARMVLTIVQGQVRTPVDGARLRTRVTESRGVLVYAFDGQGFVGPRGHTSRPTIDEDFIASAPPYDLTASFDRFSLRFAGQVRIDTAGAYTFAATVGDDDSFRIWVDGALVAHRWLAHPTVPSAAVTLAPGWHTLLVDYADEIAGASIEVTMNGAVIDPAKLRPVVVHGNTFTFANITTPTTIADLDSTFVQLPLDGDGLTLIDSVDVGFRVENQDMTQLAITLFDCMNNGRPLTANATPSYHYFPADTTCAGGTTNPTIDWSIRFTDTVAGNGIFAGLGSVRDYGVTALYRGGPNLPYAPVVTYTSKPRPTPNAARIEAVRASGDFNDTVVEVAVRAGADEAALAAAPYEVVQEGEVLAASELAQYRVTLTTNGWVAPSLDKVEIVYVTEGDSP